MPGRRADGSPTPQNPTFSLALPGAAPIGVPNFFIDRFRIPPFLLPIYQAAGIQYGIRWEVLAAINEIETDYGRNLNVSSAGALGWMQFIPSTWKAYGTDANGDGVKDPYNPVDAIFAAARYLQGGGRGHRPARARSSPTTTPTGTSTRVMLRARLIGGLPSNFVGSLTGLTQGRFPVAARATYADDLGEPSAPSALRIVEPTRAGARSRSSPRQGARVIAVNDGRVLAAHARLGGAARRLRQRLHLRAPGPRAPHVPAGRRGRPSRRRRRSRHVQGAPVRQPARTEIKPREDPAAGARQGREAHRRHRLGRLGDSGSSSSRSARPAAARRASTPSRSSTAGSCSSRRRSTAPRAATRSPRPGRRSARCC